MWCDLLYPGPSVGIAFKILIRAIDLNVFSNREFTLRKEGGLAPALPLSFETTTGKQGCPLSSLFVVVMCPDASGGDRFVDDLLSQVAGQRVVVGKLHVI